MGDGESSLAIGLGDFDNDGDVDVGVTYEGLYPSSHVLPFQNNGSGEFELLDISGDVGSGLYGHGLIFRDVNSDLLPEMIVSLSLGLYVFHNVDGSSFEVWQRFPTYGSAYSPRVGDFDGDGLLDLACWTSYGVYTPSIRYHLIFYGSCPAPCRGDTDANGIINVVDLLDMLADWGVCIDCRTDLNRDGHVNQTDLLELLLAWGACPD